MDRLSWGGSLQTWKLLKETVPTSLLVGSSTLDSLDDDEPNTGIEINVKNPTLMKESVMTKTYIIYDIEGADKHGNFQVKRRFKDFFELRTRLVENWPGVLIPPLPEKKMQV